ncbi:hypothetical protein AMS68_003295 [Peltaster fructicola]|uniref:Uncharacterized protein n=1 Tax=Peltaster fructicola TaxID=286661 RepID=A0A6H0XT33_9PEZI|nr:hypothetical protein AMS68_003295 [Peltaster fructicola]
MSSALRNNIVPLTLVTVCGVATAYAAFQPELKKTQDERLGVTVAATSTPAQPQVADDAISKAIADDFREAAKELRDTTKKGVAWGIREAIFGKSG